MYSNILRIVLIDDDVVSAKMLEKMIKQAMPDLTMEIANFQDPRSALAHIKEKDIHIVITDIEMPHISGQEVLKEVKGMSKGIKLAVITASNSLLTALSCFMDGADGYLLKPYKVQNVRDLLLQFHANLLLWREIFETCHKTSRPAAGA